MTQTGVETGHQARLRYQVDDLVVDLARMQVTRDGQVLPLPRLSFDLLVALVQAAPAVVSLDELMNRVWPTVVVGPETVSQRVKLLRDALGDDSRSPRYVAGIRGRGYRLVAAVILLGDAESTPATVPAVSALLPIETPPARATARTALTPARLGIAGAALVAMLLLAVTLLSQRDAHRGGSADANQAVPEIVPISPRSVAVLPFASLPASSEQDVLAFGIAEAVLHRLANLHELEVIARTSSFSLESKPGDVREIGRALHVRYLLEGSVQHDKNRLRVTAQLIDAQTGAHLWSVQFDRARDDIFAVQDEIATRVAKALQLSLDANAAGRLDEQSTQNFEAYLAYLQGRALLATGRVGDARRAVEHFRSALHLDAAFAAAYVSLAEADVYIAEFDVTDDRNARFIAAGRRAAVLVTKALQLNPRYGPAYLMRGYLEAFWDLKLAEASYRRGLELRPSDARGYAGLATILFEQPAKRNEALSLLEHARRLDPLDPTHDVQKAVFLLYDRGDVGAADALLREVLQRQPLFVPALTRLGEIAWCCEANPSEAIQLFEQAIALDPSAHWPRRPLVSAYLDVDDVRAASDVVMHTTRSPEVLRVPLLVYDRDWRAAGETAYDALAKDLVTPIDESIVVVAIRRHARLTGDFTRAIAAMEKLSGVRWTAKDEPLIPERPGSRISTVGLADMLLLAGEQARGKALLKRVIAQMLGEIRTGGRTEAWYYHAMTVALALAGDEAQCLDWIERGVAAGFLRQGSSDWSDAEPAFDGLRGDARFKVVGETLRRHALQERAELDQLRASGVVPTRG